MFQGFLFLQVYPFCKETRYILWAIVDFSRRKVDLLLDMKHFVSFVKVVTLGFYFDPKRLLHLLPSRKSWNGILIKTT